MKKILFLKHFVLALTMMMIASFAMAQAPQGFNYQAFVRGSEGVVASQSVSVRISIVSGSESGNVVYSETHTATTNAGGYFNITIGKGTAQNGTFADIQWGNGTYFLRSEVDPAGGSNYTIVSTQQLLSVPYALYAGGADMTYLNRRFDSLSRALTGNYEALRSDKLKMGKGSDECYATCGTVDSMGRRYADMQRRIDSLVQALAAMAGGSGGEEPAVVQIENGALPGVFSVSATKQVHFSQGNLQYQASSKTWRFAEHQYDFVGADNSNVSSSYSGWIDLFGWGTSGWKSGATNYQPYSTGTSNDGYKVGGNVQNNLTGNYAKADWGVRNAISNGGSEAGLWRTLTSAEWDYLLNSRSGATIGNTANARYCKATVNNISGIVLFPDGYSHPSSIPTPANCNTANADYSSNSYSAGAWQAMETAGAVFLPAAGFRGTSVKYSGEKGYYWSSTSNGTSGAYRVMFTSSEMAARSNGYRYVGFSVRLVQEFTDPCDGKTSATTDIQTACDSYEWHGDTYTESNNTATYTTVNATGCDSVVTLDLTINLSSTGIDEQTAGGAYTWIDGNTYIESTETPVYTIEGGNAAGCDSTVTLHLTITQSASQPWSDNDWVDLGLPSGLLWATRNVGASSPTDYGDYFAWGETEPKSNYSWETYRYYRHDSISMGYTKYCGACFFPHDCYYGHPDYMTILQPGDDAATAHYGGRTPTKEECEELINNTTSHWTTIGGVSGRIFIGPNGDSIFLPAAGYRSSTILDTDDAGIYWSSSLASLDYPWSILFGSEFGPEVTYNDDFGYRSYMAFSVRAVREGNGGGNGGNEGGENGEGDNNDNEGGNEEQTVQIENGALPGQFAVSATKKVRFSQGNLQYSASGTHACADGSSKKGTWRFAEHQYDFVGADNSKVSSSYSGWIDLFGFGTSGWNSGASAYYPYSTSTTASNYTPGGSASNNLTGNYGKADWGVYNAISNGGEAGMWRTLTSVEWDYLFNNRAGATIGNTANVRYCKAMVNNVSGIVMFPEGYIHPANIMTPTQCNTFDAGYSSNSYSVSAWQAMEAAGAVFLPAAGYRSGTSIKYGGEKGYYWSSTSKDASGAYRISFTSSDVVARSNGYRYVGFSVRLVQEMGANGTPCPGTAATGDATATAEKSLLWHGTEYVVSGNYTVPLATAAGCDSVATLHLTITNPDWVDLGLPSGLLWATRNVGANSPEDYGDYFAWGETRPKDNYSWATYRYANGRPYTETKYCFADNLTTLLSSDDAAAVNVPGSRMPTFDEWVELKENCTWEWTTQNGVNGLRFTGRNGNVVFMPATGYRRYGDTYTVGSYGCYWTSTLHFDHSDAAWGMAIEKYGASNAGEGSDRSDGYSVRPVRSAH